MAYTPTEWKTGDIISAEKLNKIENAIGTFIVEMDDNTSSLGVSYNDIMSAINAGKHVVLRFTQADLNNPDALNYGTLFFTGSGYQGSKYQVYFVWFEANQNNFASAYFIRFTADTEDSELIAGMT